MALHSGRPGFRNADDTQARIDSPPHTLINLQIVGRTGGDRPGVVFISGLTAHTPDGDVPVAEFGAADGWHIIEDYVRPGLYSLETSRNVARPGTDGSAVFSWAPGGIGAPGLRPGGPQPPLPAIVSPGILEATGAEVGDRISLGMSTFALPIVIAGVADFFPTVDPRAQPFVITDLGGFVDYANRHSRRAVGGAGEVWVAGDFAEGDVVAPGRAAEVVVDRLAGLGLTAGSVIIAEEEARLREREPLTNAGWGGLLVIMFLALALASATGIALFCWLDTRERQTEFALLRTLGSSRGQLNGVVWFNLAIVVIAGVAIGTWAGAQDRGGAAAGAGGGRRRRPGHAAPDTGNRLADAGAGLRGAGHCVRGYGNLAGAGYRAAGGATGAAGGRRRIRGATAAYGCPLPPLLLFC